MYLYVSGRDLCTTGDYEAVMFVATGLAFNRFVLLTG